MKLPIVFRQEAQSEFDEAVDWYEHRRAGLGERFVDAIQHVLEQEGVTAQEWNCTLSLRVCFRSACRKRMSDGILRVPANHGMLALRKQALRFGRLRWQDCLSLSRRMLDGGSAFWGGRQTLWRRRE